MIHSSEPPALPRILALVGMPGAGKSTVAGWFLERGIHTIRLGEVVVRELTAMGLPLTPVSEELVRQQLRQRYGKAVLASRTARQIIQQGEPTSLFVLDGLYSLTEYLFFRRVFRNRFGVLAVHASPSIRHSRLASRKVRPLTPREAYRRDLSELRNLEKGGPIALADLLVVNESNLQELFVQLETLVVKSELLQGS